MLDLELDKVNVKNIFLIRTLKDRKEVTMVLKPENESIEHMLENHGMCAVPEKKSGEYFLKLSFNHHGVGFTKLTSLPYFCGIEINEL